MLEISVVGLWFKMIGKKVMLASVNDNFLTLPCSALVRRPGLIDALGSQYGGAIDGSLIKTDCNSTLPPLPNLNNLVESVAKDQNECEGTIRFSLWSEYEKTLTEIRLYRRKLWKLEYPEVGSEHLDAAFRKLHRKEIVAATEKLAQYYSTYSGAKDEVGAADANTAINILISDAYACAFN